MIALPADFSWIGPAAFEHCTRLQTVDISRTGIQEIVGSTFARCPQLQCLKLTKTLRRIGREAFLKCSSLAGQKLAMDRVAAGGGQASSAAAIPPAPPAHPTPAGGAGHSTGVPAAFGGVGGTDPVPRIPATNLPQPPLVPATPAGAPATGA